jgi:hypothetical protein
MEHIHIQEECVGPALIMAGSCDLSIATKTVCVLRGCFGPPLRKRSGLRKREPPLVSVCLCPLCAALSLSIALSISTVPDRPEVGSMQWLLSCSTGIYYHITFLFVAALYILTGQEHSSMALVVESTSGLLFCTDGLSMRLQLLGLL